MAQHYPIRYYKQKVFRKLEESIHKRAAKIGNVRAFTGSFKFEEIYYGEEYRKTHEIPRHHRFFIAFYTAYCKIPGFDVGGHIEVHYDDIENKIMEIYFVA